jgi:cytochrome c-type biogenesis protein CcmE
MADPDLDRELARALDGTERAQKQAPPPKAVVFGSSGSGRRGSPLALAALVVFAGGIVALVLSSLKGAAIYSKTVDEVVRQRSSLEGRRVRVEGNLVHGTLERRDKPCEYRFKVERGGTDMLVHYPQCVVPDTFRDVPGVDIAVTIEGKIEASGEFQATEIMAKCPAKYDPKKRLTPGGPTYDGVPAATGPAGR